MSSSRSAATTTSQRQHPHRMTTGSTGGSSAGSSASATPLAGERGGGKSHHQLPPRLSTGGDQSLPSSYDATYMWNPRTLVAGLTSEHLEDIAQQWESLQEPSLAPVPLIAAREERGGGETPPSSPLTRSTGGRSAKTVATTDGKEEDKEKNVSPPNQQGEKPKTTTEEEEEAAAGTVSTTGSGGMTKVQGERYFEGYHYEPKDVFKDSVGSGVHHLKMMSFRAEHQFEQVSALSRAERRRLRAQAGVLHDTEVDRLAATHDAATLKEQRELAEDAARDETAYACGHRVNLKAFLRLLSPPLRDRFPSPDLLPDRVLRAKLRSLFSTLDAEGSGSVSWDTFTEYLVDTRAAAVEVPPADFLAKLKTQQQKRAATRSSGGHVGERKMSLGSSDELREQTDLLTTIGAAAADDDDEEGGGTALRTVMSCLLVTEERWGVQAKKKPTINFLGGNLDYVSRLMPMDPTPVVVAVTRMGVLYFLNSAGNDFAVLKVHRMTSPVSASTYVHNRPLKQAVPGIFAVRSFVVLATSDLKISLFPAKELDIRCRVAVHELVTCLDFCGYDQLLYGGTRSGDVLSWAIDAKGQLQPRQRYVLHEDTVNYIICTSGHRLITASSDYTLKETAIGRLPLFSANAASTKEGTASGVIATNSPGHEESSTQEDGGAANEERNQSQGQPPVAVGSSNPSPPPPVVPSASNASGSLASFGPKYIVPKRYVCTFNLPCSVTKVVHSSSHQLIVCLTADNCVTAFVESFPTVPAYKLLESSVGKGGLCTSPIIHLALDEKADYCYVIDKVAFLRVFDLKTTALVYHAPLVPTTKTKHHQVVTVALSPTFSRILVNTTMDLILARYRVTEADEGPRGGTDTVGVCVFDDPCAVVIRVCQHPAQRDMAIIFSSVGVALWDAQLQKRRSFLESPFAQTTAACLEATGQRMVLGSTLGEVGVFRLDTGRKIRQYAIPSDAGEILALEAVSTQSPEELAEQLQQMFAPTTSRGSLSSHRGSLPTSSAVATSAANKKRHRTHNPSQFVISTEKGFFFVVLDGSSQSLVMDSSGTGPPRSNGLTATSSSSDDDSFASGRHNTTPSRRRSTAVLKHRQKEHNRKLMGTVSHDDRIGVLAPIHRVFRLANGMILRRLSSVGLGTRLFLATDQAQCWQCFQFDAYSDHAIQLRPQPADLSRYKSQRQLLKSKIAAATAENKNNGKKKGKGPSHDERDTSALSRDVVTVCVLHPYPCVAVASGDGCIRIFATKPHLLAERLLCQWRIPMELNFRAKQYDSKELSDAAEATENLKRRSSFHSAAFNKTMSRKATTTGALGGSRSRSSSPPPPTLQSSQHHGSQASVTANPQQTLLSSLSMAYTPLSPGTSNGASAFSPAAESPPIGSPKINIGGGAQQSSFLVNLTQQCGTSIVVEEKSEEEIARQKAMQRIAQALCFIYPYTLASVDDRNQVVLWDISDVVLQARLLDVRKLTSGSGSASSGGTTGAAATTTRVQPETPSTTPQLSSLDNTPPTAHLRQRRGGLSASLQQQEYNEYVRAQSTLFHQVKRPPIVRVVDRCKLPIGKDGATGQYLLFQAPNLMTCVTEPGCITELRISPETGLTVLLPGGASSQTQRPSEPQESPHRAKPAKETSPRQEGARTDSNSILLSSPRSETEEPTKERGSGGATGTPPRPLSPNALRVSFVERDGTAASRSPTRIASPNATGMLQKRAPAQQCTGEGEQDGNTADGGSTKKGVVGFLLRRRSSNMSSKGIIRGSQFTSFRRIWKRAFIQIKVCWLLTKSLGASQANLHSYDSFVKAQSRRQKVASGLQGRFPFTTDGTYLLGALADVEDETLPSFLSLYLPDQEDAPLGPGGFRRIGSAFAGESSSETGTATSRGPRLAIGVSSGTPLSGGGGESEDFREETEDAVFGTPRPFSGLASGRRRSSVSPPPQQQQQQQERVRIPDPFAIAASAKRTSITTFLTALGAETATEGHIASRRESQALSIATSMDTDFEEEATLKPGIPMVRASMKAKQHTSPPPVVSKSVTELKLCVAMAGRGGSPAPSPLPLSLPMETILEPTPEREAHPQGLREEEEEERGPSATPLTNSSAPRPKSAEKLSQYLKVVTEEAERKQRESWFRDTDPATIMRNLFPATGGEESGNGGPSKSPLRNRLAASSPRRQHDESNASRPPQQMFAPVEPPPLQRVCSLVSAHDSEAPSMAPKGSTSIRLLRRLKKDVSLQQAEEMRLQATASTSTHKSVSSGREGGSVTPPRRTSPRASPSDTGLSAAMAQFVQSVALFDKAAAAATTASEGEEEHPPPRKKEQPTTGAGEEVVDPRLWVGKRQFKLKEEEVAEERHRHRSRLLREQAQRRPTSAPLTRQETVKRGDSTVAGGTASLSLLQHSVAGEGKWKSPTASDSEPSIPRCNVQHTIPPRPASALLRRSVLEEEEEASTPTVTLQSVTGDTLHRALQAKKQPNTAGSTRPSSASVARQPLLATPPSPPHKHGAPTSSPASGAGSAVLNSAQKKAHAIKEALQSYTDARKVTTLEKNVQRSAMQRTAYREEGPYRAVPSLKQRY